MTAKLTPKQSLFVKEYLVDLNATQAAIRAGYSKKTAEKIGSENLHKPELAAAIQEAMDKRAEKTELTADYVIHGLIEVHKRCMQAEPVMTRNNDGELVESGEYKFEHSGANRSLELLGKNLKLFTDRVEVSADTSLAERLSSARKIRNNG